MKYQLNDSELKLKCKNKGMDYIQYKAHLQQVIDMAELLYSDMKAMYLKASNGGNNGYLMSVDYLKLHMFNDLYQPLILSILKQKGLEFYTVEGFKGWLINE